MYYGYLFEIFVTKLAATFPLISHLFLYATNQYVDRAWQVDIRYKLCIPLEISTYLSWLIDVLSHKNERNLFQNLEMFWGSPYDRPDPDI